MVLDPAENQQIGVFHSLARSGLDTSAHLFRGFSKPASKINFRCHALCCFFSPGNWTIRFPPIHHNTALPFAWRSGQLTKRYQKAPHVLQRFLLVHVEREFPYIPLYSPCLCVVCLACGNHSPPNWDTLKDHRSGWVGIGGRPIRTGDEGGEVGTCFEGGQTNGLQVLTIPRFFPREPLSHVRSWDSALAIWVCVIVRCSQREVMEKGTTCDPLTAWWGHVTPSDPITTRAWAFLRCSQDR